MDKKPERIENNKTRKGARRISEIPEEVLRQLHLGTIETVNLVEALAIDFSELARSIHLKNFFLSQTGIVKRMEEMGKQLPKWEEYKDSPSDTVRGWACYSLVNDKRLSFAEKLKEMKLFASDSHFGVREWAWLAIRPQIKQNLNEAIAILSQWSKSSESTIRRFASEATRPKGVWTPQIDELKKDPSLGLPILEPLKADPEKYVQDSVGNWLNDASKHQPNWVIELCERWEKNKNAATEKIIQRAMRTLEKASKNDRPKR